MMSHSRRDDNGGINLTKERMIVFEALGMAAEGNSLGLLGVDIDNTDEFHLGHFGQDAGMLFAQMSHADYGQPQTAHNSPLSACQSQFRTSATRLTAQGIHQFSVE